MMTAVLLPVFEHVRRNTFLVFKNEFRIFGNIEDDLKKNYFEVLKIYTRGRRSDYRFVDKLICFCLSSVFFGFDGLYLTRWYSNFRF